MNRGVNAQPRLVIGPFGQMLSPSKAPLCWPLLSRCPAAFRRLCVGAIGVLEELARRLPMGMAIVTGRPRADCDYFLKKHG